MSWTIVVFQFGGQWVRSDACVFQWEESSDSNWQSVHVDGDSCTIQDLSESIVDVLGLEPGTVKLEFSYLPKIQHPNPRPIFIRNDRHLRVYFAYGGPESRPLLYVSGEHIEKNVASDNGFDAAYNLNDDHREIGESSQILTIDELACIQPFEEYCPEPNEQFGMSTPIYDASMHIEDDVDIGGHCAEDGNGVSPEFDEVRFENSEDDVEYEGGYGEDDVAGNQVSVGEDGTYAFSDGTDWVIGQKFPSKKHVKNELQRIAIKAQFQFKLVNSNKSMYIVKCLDDRCSWRLRGALDKNSTTFSIRSYCGTHTCGVSHLSNNHRQGNSELMASMLRENFNNARDIPSPRAIQSMMQNQGVNVTYYKACKGKELLMNELVGDEDNCFGQIPTYLDLVREVNPGSVNDFLVDDDNRFNYLFLAFAACINGFCFIRKVVSIDGTFLKGKYKGVLLVATAQDGNHQQYPLAWGVADVESTESWTWFLTNLRGIVDDTSNLVIISDRHPGIINAVKHVFQNAFHGFCAWHLRKNIITNVKKKGSGDFFWRLTHAYTQSEFQALYRVLENDFSELKAYLTVNKNCEKEKWSRAYCPGSRYNIMTTNGSESINAALREYRALPIIGLLDSLHMLCATWFSSRRRSAQVGIQRGVLQFIKSVEEILRRHYIQAQRYHVAEIGYLTYNVYGQSENEVVELEKRSCSCRMLDIDRIPCPHTTAACGRGNDIEVNSFVHDYYTMHF